GVQPDTTLLMQDSIVMLGGTEGQSRKVTLHNVASPGQSAGEYDIADQASWQRLRQPGIEIDQSSGALGPGKSTDLATVLSSAQQPRRAGGCQLAIVRSAKPASIEQRTQCAQTPIGRWQKAVTAGKDRHWIRPAEADEAFLSILDPDAIREQAIRCLQ